MPLIRRRPLAGLAALGAVALIAGCGGGSDTLSADDFREQADAICADANREIEGLTEPTSADEFLPFLRSGLEIQTAQTEKLKALEPPSDLEAPFNEAVELIEQKNAAIEGAADRIEAGEDPETVVTAIDADIEAIDEQADGKAEALGLTVCGTEATEVTQTTATTPTAPSSDTAPATVTAPATDTAPATGAGDTSAYVADVQEAAGALQSFGTLLQSTTGLDDLKAKVPEAQANLDTFDTAIAKLDGYTLPTAQLERQRTGLLRTGPKVSDVLRRFLDAAGTGDLSAVQALVPEVTSTIGEFQQAATAG